MLRLQLMACDQNTGGRWCRSALPGEQIVRESQLKAAEAKKKKSDTKIIYPSEALLLPLASLNMGDRGTAMRRSWVFLGVFLAK